MTVGNLSHASRSTSHSSESSFNHKYHHQNLKNNNNLKNFRGTNSLSASGASSATGVNSNSRDLSVAENLVVPTSTEPIIIKSACNQNYTIDDFYQPPVNFPSKDIENRDTLLEIMKNLRFWGE